jgi:hypothetical protein
MNRLPLSVAACALAVATAVPAGVVVETVERDAKSGATGDVSRLYVQGSTARMEDSGDGKGFVLFRDGTLYVVEPAERRYTALDREAVAGAAGQMGAAMAQVQKQLASLPPEQRKMMEQMMGGKLPGTAPARPPLEARDLGRDETVDGRSCRVWELARGGKVENQVCVVAFSALPGQEDLLGVMRQINELMQPMVEVFEGFGGMSDDAEAVAAVQGFPVLWRDFDDGRPNGRETVLKSWREEAIPADLLQVPAGFQQRELPTVR